MITTGLIILTLMLLAVVAGLFVLFKAKRTPNVIDVPFYKPSVNNILFERDENSGVFLTQEELLDNTNYVLNAFDPDE